MKIFLIPLLAALALPTAVNAVERSITIDSVSQLSIIGFEDNENKANVIALVGGKGLRNGKGKSKNFLVRNKNIFASNRINYYIFPNWSENELATYPLRITKIRTQRILNLVNYLKKQNDLPTYILGFSRGSVDAGSFAIRNPNSIKGIVLASGIYKNKSKKASNYSMEKIIGKEIKTHTLVVHHKKDTCVATPFKYAEKFFSKLKAPKKKQLFYTSGNPTGEPCGPNHFHGFEGIEKDVASDISDWIKNNS